ncbi:GNAT family acetyltransferase [Gallaecimonas xiamenensis]|uniref:Acetyltransferase (GNAT) family protein n=1 Tax=Gallaecimonas xiamenensis 3-C-1 TaxID=745411 RepID=K2JTN9_9GAMM|nr:acetyltransferase (GNAT) family protein [Gallaecimonas xiamenensis 3-C-1]
MAAAIAEAKKAGAKGIVLLGDPAYYGRFGFRHYPGLVLPGVPAPYFQALVLAGQVPSAQVCYHSAFEAQA